MDKPEIISLRIGDGQEVKFAFITVFPLEDKNYIALLRLDENEMPATDEVSLFSLVPDEKGMPIIANIESDAEYENASYIFDKILQAAQQKGAPEEK